MLFQWGMFRKLPSLKLTAKATENEWFEDEISSWVFLFSGAFWLVGFRECNVRSSDGFCSEKSRRIVRAFFFGMKLESFYVNHWDIGPAIAKWKFFAMVLTWFNLKSQVCQVDVLPKISNAICCTCIIWDSYLSHRIHTTSIFTKMIGLNVW